MAAGKISVSSIMQAAFLALALTGVAAASWPHTDSNALEAWNQHFPTLPFPQPLLSLLSPLTPSQILRFSADAKDGTLLTNPSSATSFCKEAKAWCEDPQASIHHPTKLLTSDPNIVTTTWDAEANPKTHHPKPDLYKLLASDPNIITTTWDAEANPKIHDPKPDLYKLLTSDPNIVTTTWDAEANPKSHDPKPDLYKLLASDPNIVTTTWDAEANPKIHDDLYKLLTSDPNIITTTWDVDAKPKSDERNLLISDPNIVTTTWDADAKPKSDDPNLLTSDPNIVTTTWDSNAKPKSDDPNLLTSDPNIVTTTWDVDAKPKTHDLKRLTSPTTIVFHERDLLPGTKMMLNLHTHYPFRSFLPRSVADALPFSSTELFKIAQVFNPLNSHLMLTTMQRTLRNCESPAAVKIGEVKACATSMEAMLDFVDALLGSSHLKMMKTNATSKEASKPAEMYKLVDVPSYRPPAKAMSVVICHEALYPYLVYHCHQIRDTKVFEVKLEAGDGKPMTAVVACHVNTTNWNPNNIAFQLLKTPPGPHTDVCHFLSSSTLAWVSTKDS